MSKPVARIVAFVPWLPQPIFLTYQDLAPLQADMEKIRSGEGLLTVRVGRGQGHEYEEYIRAAFVAHWRMEVFG